MNGLSIARMYWLKMTSGKLVFMFMYELMCFNFLVSLKHPITDVPQINFVRLGNINGK